MTSTLVYGSLPFQEKAVYCCTTIDGKRVYAFVAKDSITTKNMATAAGLSDYFLVEENRRQFYKYTHHRHNSKLAEMGAIKVSIKYFQEYIVTAYARNTMYPKIK